MIARSERQQSARDRGHKKQPAHLYTSCSPSKSPDPLLARYALHEVDTRLTARRWMDWGVPSTRARVVSGGEHPAGRQSFSERLARYREPRVVISRHDPLGDPALMPADQVLDGQPGADQEALSGIAPELGQPLP